jgi:hypothetical protein
MKLYVLALKHTPSIRMADVVAAPGKDDENFVAEYDAVTAAMTRLRAASIERFGEDATRKVARGMLSQPDDDQLRALFARMDDSLPAADVKGDSVKLGAAAAEFYAMSAVRSDNGWRIALVPQVTTPLVALAEFGDLRAFAVAVGEIADGVAQRKVDTPQSLDERLLAALHARGESMEAASDLKPLQGRWERKPVGDELEGDVVVRVIGTVSGVHLTTTYYDRKGGVVQAVRVRMIPSRCGDFRLITMSDLEFTEGPNVGIRWGGANAPALYAVRRGTWTYAVGFRADDKSDAGTLSWRRYQ